MCIRELNGHVQYVQENISALEEKEIDVENYHSPTGQKEKLTEQTFFQFGLIVIKFASESKKK